MRSMRLISKLVLLLTTLLLVGLLLIWRVGAGSSWLPPRLLALGSVEVLVALTCLLVIPSIICLNMGFTPSGSLFVTFLFFR